MFLHDDPSNLTEYASSPNDLLQNKNWYKFADAVDNTGSYSIDPANLNGIGNAYVLLIVATDGWDVSDSTFTLQQ